MTEVITVADLIEVEKNMLGRSVKNNKSTILISLHIPILWNKTIKRMVKRGEFINRSDTIRHMIQDYFVSNGIEVKER